ncbi:hypothetical protein FACS189485_10200 [Spirochaetia bacterium]|nr:hypothetical protein FACS189485_10200 [Spirochaetia bacterium]
MDKENEKILPGSISAAFPCTLIHQALIPSPLDCEYFYTKTVGRILHEYCGNLDLTTKKDVKGGSWSKKYLPPCYLCNKYEKKKI